MPVPWDVFSERQASLPRKRAPWRGSPSEDQNCSGPDGHHVHPDTRRTIVAAARRLFHGEADPLAGADVGRGQCLARGKIVVAAEAVAASAIALLEARIEPAAAPQRL